MAEQNVSSAISIQN
jgi:hypothetical protein